MRNLFGFQEEKKSCPICVVNDFLYLPL